MARDFAKSFYKSSAWKKCRASFIASRHGLCERCGGVGGICHHKVYLTPENINDPDVTLNWDNLELLCATCHQHEHFMKNSPTRDDVMFDENGDLIEKGRGYDN